MVNDTAHFPKALGQYTYQVLQFYGVSGWLEKEEEEEAQLELIADPPTV